MLNHALWRLFPHLWSFHIPCVVVRNHSLYIPIKPISASDQARFRARYGAFQPLKWANRIPKWCFLQNEKIPFNRKSLTFSILWKSLIIRVFAPEEESVRKYALIFRGITENQGGKIRICFQSESATYCCHSGSKKPRCLLSVTRLFIVTITWWIYIEAEVCLPQHCSLCLVTVPCPV